MNVFIFLDARLQKIMNLFSILMVNTGDVNVERERIGVCYLCYEGKLVWRFGYFSSWEILLNIK